MGLKKGYLNTSLPFGSVDVTAIALSIKNSGSDGLWLPLDENTNFAIISAAKQAGANLKVVESATGYGQALLNDPTAVQTAQGVYFTPVGPAGGSQHAGDPELHRGPEDLRPLHAASPTSGGTRAGWVPTS